MRVCAAPRVRPSEACHLGTPRGASRQACHAGTSCGASRQACHAGGHAGRATPSAAVGEFHTPTAAKTGGVARKTARSTSSRRPSWGRPLLWGRLSSLRPTFQPAWVPFTHGPLRNPIVPPPQVEQAARLAMPAVTPAERPNPERYGSPNAIRPARLRAPPQAAAARWSKPPGLPCRRSRRQSNTIPNGTGVPIAIRPARLRAPREHPVKFRNSRGRLESPPDQPRAKLSPFAH